MEILGGVILCCLGVYAVLRHAYPMAAFWLVIACVLFWRAWTRHRSGIGAEMGLRQWPWHRVALAGILWALAVCGFMTWRIFVQMPDAPVAAISFGLLDPMLVALGPPFLLAVAWLLARRQGSTS